MERVEQGREVDLPAVDLRRSGGRQGRVERVDQVEEVDLVRSVERVDLVDQVERVDLVDQVDLVERVDPVDPRAPDRVLWIPTDKRTSDKRTYGQADLRTSGPERNQADPSRHGRSQPCSPTSGLGSGERSGAGGALAGAGSAGSELETPRASE